MYKKTDVEKYGLSIIIPVYNVENYIDQCLYSCSVKQHTHYDYEIVIVDDGATDKSGSIAKRWGNENDNIRYVYQDNQGLGAARNTGLKYAKMPYITFVDSDDWIAEDFVECMMNCVETENYDLVYCDAFNYNSENGMISRNPFRLNLQLLNADYSQRMFFGYPNMWGAVYKKSVFIDKNLRIPHVVYEDTAYYGILLDSFEKIGCCGRELYYYRTGRKGSLMNLNYMKNEVMLHALLVLAEEAHRHKIFKKNYMELMDFTIRQLQTEWNLAIRNENTSMVRNSITNFLEDFYPDWKDYYLQKCAALGSSNVCVIYHRVKMFREKVGDKYQFFSFVSFVSDPMVETDFNFNPDAAAYRKEMIKKQITGNLFEKLSHNDTIIIDLFDELHDIIRVGNCYLNRTDAFDSTITLFEEYDVISYDSEERYLLWKKGIDAFSRWASENNKTVILLKYDLCTESGDAYTKRKYDNLELIEKKNKILEKYYGYVEQECKEFAIVDLPDTFHYTDEKYAFGRSSEYFNSFAYYVLSYKLIEKWRKLRGSQSDFR